MRTIKQVSELTGVSIRMLHYYDKIGLLKPSTVTEAGYRLYDEEALLTLQQILFYKELDLPLKEVKDIMYRPDYDITQALKNQKKLLLLKSKRLNDLIELINKRLKGDHEMSFKEFDMSEFYQTMEEFKTEHEDKILKAFGSIDKYNNVMEKVQSKEDEIAQMAIKKYGSIEKYANAIKKNFNSEMFTIAEQCDEFRKDFLEEKNPSLTRLIQMLVSDLSKDPVSEQIRKIAGEITDTAKQEYQVFDLDPDIDYWFTMVQSFLLFPDWIAKVDLKYGDGASKFIGVALKNYLADKVPRDVLLYRQLTSDLTKKPDSQEIQEIVEEIVKLTNKSHEILNIEAGENYWNYTAELFLTNGVFIKANDEKYGTGASKFIGEALSCYANQKK